MVRILLTNGLVGGLCILAIEIYFGSWVYKGQLNKLNIPRNVEIHYSNTQTNHVGWQAVYTRDKFGLRGDYADLSLVDILTLGGSTTDQRLISDKHTWQSVMQDKFKRNKTPMTIVNAGIDGQSSVGHVRAFDLWLNEIPSLRTKWVLAYVGINDMRLSGRMIYDTMMTSPNTLKKRIIKNSAMYHLYRTLSGMIIAEYYNLNHNQTAVSGDTWTTMPKSPHASTSDLRKLAAFETRIRTLSSHIQTFGARPIFVTQPIAIATPKDGRVMLREGQNPNDYFALNRFNKRLKEVCLTLSAVCIDLANQLSFDSIDFYDLFHTTPRGSKKIGIFLFHALKMIVLK